MTITTFPLSLPVLVSAAAVLAAMLVRTTPAASHATVGASSADLPPAGPSPSGAAVRRRSARMRAIAQVRYGGPEALELTELDVPTPGDGEVLIAVDAAGVDRGVWHLTTGLPLIVRLAGYGVRRPKQPIPGMDVSGDVVAVGAGVTRFAVGDAVFGIGSGTFAEFALASEAKLARKPKDVDATVAAITPISGLTALQALRDVGRVEPGQRVLVLGASGGVGSFVVQLAKHFGAHVTGVAGTAKLDLVRALGADEVVDYTAGDPLRGDDRYDLIIDTGGRHPVRRLRRALARRGTLVIVGGEGGGRITGGFGRQLRALAISPFVSQRLTTFVSAERGDDVATLGELLAGGVLHPALDRAYPLEDAPLAIADLAAGRVRGKAVVRVANPS